MIERNMTSSVLNDFNRRKVIVLLGARQVGKTTLLEMLKEGKQRVLSLNCDDYDDASLVEDKTTTELKNLLGN